MVVVLRTLRCPAGVAPASREVTGHHFSIGRGADSDWPIPDPDRVLSKRHCEIAAHENGWLVTDTSSNGTFLNGACLEPEVPHPVRSGDRLAFGAYEIEVRLEADAAAGEDAFPRRGGAPTALDEDRQTGDPFPPLEQDPLQAATPSIGLPSDFDPLGDASGRSDVVADHAPDLREHFRPPRPSFELIPEDWDLEAAPANASPIAADRHDPEPRPPPPVTASVPIPPSTGVHASDHGASFAVFAAGAGVSGVPSGDPEATLRALGAAFRAVVSGLRRMMIARATVKGEFRIEQTMIQAVGNNPLKFSADDDDALAALLGVGRRGGMSPERAISDALRDMRLHELAVASAMQHAVRDLLAELDPARLTDATRQGGFDRLSGRGDRRAWEAAKKRHAEMVRALADDFDSVFGKSFVRAYEAAMADIARQHGERVP